MTPDASNWVEAEEIRKARRNAFVLGGIFGSGAIILGMIVVLDCVDVLGTSGWSWKSLLAVARLIIPIAIARAAVQQFKSVRDHG